MESNHIHPTKKLIHSVNELSKSNIIMQKEYEKLRMKIESYNYKNPMAYQFWYSFIKKFWAHNNVINDFLNGFHLNELSPIIYAYYEVRNYHTKAIIRNPNLVYIPGFRFDFNKNVRFFNMNG